MLTVLLTTAELAAPRPSELASVTCQPMVRLVPVAKKGRLRGWGKLKRFRTAIDAAFTSEIDKEIATSLKGRS